MLRPGPVVIAALLLTTAAAAAAEEQATAGHAPFVFVIDARVDPELLPTWRRAVTRAAEAHARHEAGNSWAAFRAVTGGPDAEFRFVFPLQKLGDLDAWLSNRRIVIESLGPDLGQQVLKGLELRRESADRILALSPELSRPAPADRPANYLWTARVTVEPGRMIEYAALVRRVKQAHARHEHGMHWLAYGNAVGGDENELVFVMPFERFAELDDWPLDGEVLRDALGDREAGRLIEAFHAITRTTTGIWKLAPELSQMQGPAN